MKKTPFLDMSFVLYMDLSISYQRTETNIQKKATMLYFIFN